MKKMCTLRDISAIWEMNRDSNDIFSQGVSNLQYYSKYQWKITCSTSQTLYYYNGLENRGTSVIE